MWTVGDQLKQYRALSHNQIMSVTFQVKNGSAMRGEVEANMRVVDDRARRIALLETYKSNIPYTGQDK